MRGFNKWLCLICFFLWDIPVTLAEEVTRTAKGGIYAERLIRPTEITPSITPSGRDYAALTVLYTAWNNFQTRGFIAKDQTQTSYLSTSLGLIELGDIYWLVVNQAIYPIRFTAFSAWECEITYKGERQVFRWRQIPSWIEPHLQVPELVVYQPKPKIPDVPQAIPWKLPRLH